MIFYFLFFICDWYDFNFQLITYVSSHDKMWNIWLLALICVCLMWLFTLYLWWVDIECTDLMLFFLVVLNCGIALLDMQITTGKNDKGLKLYDPGYLNTAPVRSSICYIDGDEGILRYRGYPIEELAESSTFLEVAYLLSKFSVDFS